MNILTGEPELVFENTRQFDFVTTDRDYDPRFATRYTEDGVDYFEATEDGDWEPFFDIGFEDDETTGFESIIGDRAYMTDSRGRDTAAVTVMDLETGESEVLAEDPKANVDSVLQDPA